jgi:predicted nucleic-acid-binding protein
VEQVISVDTNVLVTLLVRDTDPAYPQVERQFAQNFIYVPPTVLLEAEWVIRTVYKWPKADVLSALVKVLELPNVETEKWVSKAMDWSVRGLETADALHLAGSEGSDHFYTFDRDLIRKGRGLEEAPPFYQAGDF